MAKAKPDERWDRVDAYVADEHERLAACDGWVAGVTVGDSVDHPGTIFLTSDSLIIDVRPQTVRDPEIIFAPFIDIARLETVTHPGGVRIAFVAGPGVSEEIFAEMMGDAADLQGVAFDLPASREGRKFARLAKKTMKR